MTTMLVILPFHGVAANIHFVSTSSASPTPPFGGWETAALDIQSAVDVASHGSIVIVRAGVYDTGGRTRDASHALTNRVLIDKPILVVSEHNDPENTIIMGAWDPVTTNGPAAVRPVYLRHSGATLIGFTLTNGATLNTGGANSPGEFCGGGIFVEFGNYVSNCIISGNVAQSMNQHGGGGAYRGTYVDCRFINNGFENNPVFPRGGGVFNGNLVNCHLIGNTAQNGGGVFRGHLYNCNLISNVATVSGGGSHSATLADSTLQQNFAQYGGGATGGALANCLVVSNVATRFGGGTMNAAVESSTLMQNFAPIGGGAHGGRLINCTVVMNHGRGVASSGVTNSIVYYNEPANHLGDTLFGNSCTYPDPGGPNNITNAPGFLLLDEHNPNLQLVQTSPCINAGLNGVVTVGHDRDGNPRIVGGVVDIGAYESPYASIDASAGAGGTILPAGRTNVLASSHVILPYQILPDTPGYAVKDVRVNGRSIGPVFEYCFDLAPIGRGHSIHVDFLEKPEPEAIRFEIARVDAARGLVIHWYAAENWEYRLQQSPSLTPPTWSDMPLFLEMRQTHPDLVTVTNIPPTEPSMFFRLIGNPVD